MSGDVEDAPARTQQWEVKNPADLQWTPKEALPQTPSPAADHNYTVARQQGDE